MKITIESLENGDSKITFNFNNKDYSEIWVDTGSVYSVEGNILAELELDGISAQNTDISDLLNSTNIIDFMSLADREKQWVDA